MTAKSWLLCIQDAEKTCLVQDGKRKVHYKFRDGREMVEEYNLETKVMNRRAWKVCKKFGSQPTWEVEVGDAEVQLNLDLDALGIKETSTAPFVTLRNTRNALEWRIRNLPYSLDTYQVIVNPNAESILVKTTNKKYFKELPVLDMQRIGIKLEQQLVGVGHKHNTLIISYKKPPELLLSEKLILEELNKVKTTQEGDIQCAQS